MECRMLQGCKTGAVKITGGYRLPAKHVIHAVGPVWNGGGNGEDALLSSCYAGAIRLCQSHALASVAFPAISTGIYRFPADRAARIAVAASVTALATAPGIDRVIFCCFSDESARLHALAVTEIGDPAAVQPASFAGDR